MASTRATTRQRGSARHASTGTPKSALIAVARHTARIQIAACTAAFTTATGWAQAADRFVQAVGDELLRRIDGETDSPELITRLSAAANSHLHELAGLPRTAADHFDARLARLPIDS